jgi:hypothetical protein
MILQRALRSKSQRTKIASVFLEPSVNVFMFPQ